MTGDRKGRRRIRATEPLSPASCYLFPDSAATAGWPWRGCPTRSHPELDRETPQRRWYCVLRRGRVGRRPALPAENRRQNIRNQQPGRTAAPPRRPLPASHTPTPKPSLTTKASPEPSASPTLASGSGSRHPNAGWSSPVARQAHNLKVAGSNPAPATRIYEIYQIVTECLPRLEAAALVPLSAPWKQEGAKKSENPRVRNIGQHFVIAGRRRRRLWPKGSP